jgi:hypothetical protein
VSLLAQASLRAKPSGTTLRWTMTESLKLNGETARSFNILFNQQSLAQTWLEHIKS